MKSMLDLIDFTVINSKLLFFKNLQEIFLPLTMDWMAIGLLVIGFWVSPAAQEATADESRMKDEHDEYMKGEAQPPFSIFWPPGATSMA